jgi:hypothetical protein
MISKEFLNRIIWYTLTFEDGGWGSYFDVVTIKYKGKWWARTKRFKFKRNGTYTSVEAYQALAMVREIENYLKSKDS